MPTQAEEQHRSQPEEEQTDGDPIVSSRVSELLDNATVAPDDDFAREALETDELTQNDPTPDSEAGTTSQEESSGLDVIDRTDGSTADLSLVDDDQKPIESATGTEPLSDDTVVDSAHSDESEQGNADDPIVEATPAEEQPVEATTEDTNQESVEERTYSDDGDQMSPATVRIRGRPGGVLVEIEDQGEWEDILELLEERLDAAEGFFRGGKAVIEVGPRDVYEDELRKARDMLARHDMTLAVVRSTSDLTLQSSLLLGLSTSSQVEEKVETDRDMAPVVPITQPKSPYFVHNGTLRSGQVLRRSESIMVVGDINPGAKVISGGDVMVWGRLRGMAYAGANGNTDARVAAIEFAPTQLRITNVTAVPPDAPQKRGLRFWRKPEPEKRPEVAHIADGVIVVEPWDDSRPGRPRIASK